MLYDWAKAWGIPWPAVIDLQRRMGMEGTPTVVPSRAGVADSEETVSAIVRYEASRKGVLLWRNNVGALQDSTGRYVRYGLANDSSKVNEKIKSGDLVGIRPVLIGQQHVGHTIGQFVSREIKHGGWHYTGQGREPAQLKWAQIVNAAGGDASFSTGEGSL